MNEISFQKLTGPDYLFGKAYISTKIILKIECVVSEKNNFDFPCLKFPSCRSRGLNDVWFFGQLSLVNNLSKIFKR